MPLQEPVTDIRGEISVDKVHDAYSRPSVVAHFGLRGRERLGDSVDHWAQVFVGRLAEFLVKLHGLQSVVFPIFLQQLWGQVLNKMPVLLLPVLGVGGAG